MIYNENSNAPKRVIAQGLGEAKTALRIFVQTREHLLPRRHAYINRLGRLKEGCGSKK